MSLFKWSTPERRAEDRDLRIIPNEIYLAIFEHIAPPSGRLSPEDLGTLTNLSLVCRFFGNLCLPRIFEYLELSGSVFGDHNPLPHRNDATSRGMTLCSQIAAKEPLALSLAQCVKVCHFRDWRLGTESSWVVQAFSRVCVAGIARMKNIRELKFFGSFVNKGHWDVIHDTGGAAGAGFCRLQFFGRSCGFGT
ncbi:hypothetical protein BU15DRAFT_63714 [Melanogaster broomeanus]|nr:hypothetical protein BU15DRAFT_63714 [Melanogaster broomeanus]